MTQYTGWRCGSKERRDGAKKEGNEGVKDEKGVVGVKKV